MNLTKKAPILATLSVLAATALIAACGGAAPAQILASDQNIAYFANEIAGDEFNIELIREGGDTLHGFNPTPSELIRLSEAENVLIFNFAIEEWAKTIPEDTVPSARFIAVIDDEHLTVAAKEDADHAHEDETATTEDDHGHEDEATDDAHDDEATDEDDHALVEEPTDDDHGHEDEEPTDADETVVHDNDAHDDEATDDDHAHEDETTVTDDEHAHEDEAADDGHGHSHEGVDPHVAIDPMVMINLVNKVRDALIEIAPDNRELFTDNAKMLITRLEGLDNAYHEAGETCVHHEFVADQNLFARLARYGIEAIPIYDSVDHSSDISLAQLTAIVDLIQEDEIEYILTVATAESDSLDVKSVVDDTGVEVLPAYSFETLIEGEFDYFEQAEANLEAIETALGCANLTASG